MLRIWLALSMNFTNQQYVEKFVHRGLSLAIYLKMQLTVMVLYRLLRLLFLPPLRPFFMPRTTEFSNFLCWCKFNEKSYEPYHRETGLNIFYRSHTIMSHSGSSVLGAVRTPSLI